jgi:DNA-binding CsgD family transcriptional regulator
VAHHPGRRLPVPLLCLSAVVVLVVVGLARGLWLPNLHNGLLALAFTVVGVYVLNERPGHREGLLLLATGAVEAVLFLGRQLGHDPPRDGGTWWGWLGVWPVAAGLALATLSVICFPDGRLPSRRWRPVVAAVLVLATGCLLLSALWPVEYASTGVASAHPFALPGPAIAGAVWRAVAHPVYAAFQLLWVVAVVARWRGAGPVVRAQLTWVVLAAAGSAGALVTGLLAVGSPRAGLLTAALVPLAAGWAIVHGQQLAAYSALTWLSRAVSGPAGLPADLARALSEALGGPAVVWIGDERALHEVGVWPEREERTPPTALGPLLGAPGRVVRPVVRDGAVLGAVGVDRAPADPLSRAEERLLDGLASQAVLVVEHVALIRDAAGPPASGGPAVDRAGALTGLTPRERQVLDLMARGLSNAAICAELHLSIKTVEPVIGAIFTKLGLGQDSASNRRVLAVLAFLRA